MNEQILIKLKEKGVKFQKGLTNEEILEIEYIYEIQFPDSLKELLMIALPVSKGFYNWRDTEKSNITYIKNIINRPFADVDELAEEVYWNDDWGDEPQSKKDIALEVKKRLKDAPKLIPIFSHRYMPAMEDGSQPIISIHGLDIIYYGKDIEDYLEVEFGEKNQDKIDFASIQPIRFWSDMCY